MIQICDLTVHLPDFSLQNINLDIGREDFFILLGPTGNGKTLLLETIIGLVPISEGRIYLKGRDITKLPLEKRGIGIVYQDHALFPHLTVHDNVLFGLKYRKRDCADLKKNAFFLMEQLGISHLLNRSTSNLSGGEKQRTALARALAVKPDLLLLDEPLSSLDPNFREEIRELLKDLHKKMGTTILMVTHDFAEAHFLATHAGIINKGKIEQIGSVEEIFFHPKTAFAAKFVGIKNIFPAKIRKNKARVNGLELTIAAYQKGKNICIRPENIQLKLNKTKTPNAFSGSIVKITSHGFYVDIDISLQNIVLRTIITMNMLTHLNLKKNDNIYLSISPDNIHVF